jgi:hypothetical protein
VKISSLATAVMVVEMACIVSGNLDSCCEGDSRAREKNQTRIPPREASMDLPRRGADQVEIVSRTTYAIAFTT